MSQGTLPIVAQIRSSQRKDIAQTVKWGTVEAHTDAVEQTIMNVTSTAGTLLSIAVRGVAVTGRKISTIKINIDAAGDETLTSADDLWAANPTASSEVRIIPINARFKDSCVVKVTADSSAGTAYSGVLYTEDQ
jgi:hypothetical protein